MFISSRCLSRSTDPVLWPSKAESGRGFRTHGNGWLLSSKIGIIGLLLLEHSSGSGYTLLMEPKCTFCPSAAVAKRVVQDTIRMNEARLFVRLFASLCVVVSGEGAGSLCRRDANE